MNSKTRILEFLAFKGVSKNQFYKETGLSNGFLDKTNNIGSDKLEIIISAYRDLNLFWLITGEGKMLLDDDVHPNVYSNVYSNRNVHSKEYINEDTPGYRCQCNGCQEKQKIIEALEKTVSSMERTVQTQTELINYLKSLNPDQKTDYPWA